MYFSLPCTHGNYNRESAAHKHTHTYTHTHTDWLLYLTSGSGKDFWTKGFHIAAGIAKSTRWMSSSAEIFCGQRGQPLRLQENTRKQEEHFQRENIFIHLTKHLPLPVTKPPTDEQMVMKQACPTSAQMSLCVIEPSWLNQKCLLTHSADVYSEISPSMSF